MLLLQFINFSTSTNLSESFRVKELKESKFLFSLEGNKPASKINYVNVETIKKC